MTKISLCMIVKNEELFLELCLSSIKDFVDEIIIVDTGSDDSTKEIAKKYTDKIYDFKWVDDFSKARNYSLSFASHDWILILDADEIITKEDMESIRLILEDTDYDSYYLVQRNYSKDKSQKSWTAIDSKTAESKDYEGYIRNPIIRLFKNKLGIEFRGAVHEIVDSSVKELHLKVGHLEFPIHHYMDEKQANSLHERQLKYLEIAENELKKNPSGRLYSNAGAIYLIFIKDYAKAKEYFQKAADLGYKKEESLEGVADCCIHLNDHKSAYEIYKKLVASGYMTSSLCNNLANLLVMHKHYKPALKYLKLALEKGNPNNERIQKNIEAIKMFCENKDELP